MIVNIGFCFGLISKSLIENNYANQQYLMCQNVFVGAVAQRN